jgi:hypothetical protein
MLANSQEEYYRKVDAAVQLAYDLLTKHNLRPQKYRVHIRSMGYSDPKEPHALTISTADGSVWVTETSFPFRCLEEMDPFGGDAFSSIVADRLRELVKKVRHSGRAL